MSKVKRKSDKNRVFKEAVEKTEDIKNCFQEGLKAFGAHSKSVMVLGSAEGSVDIDKCTAAKYPNANRWDYAFGYKDAAYFIEVHSAETGEVTRVLRKLQWLKDWLNSEAPELNKIKGDRPYYWIQSGRYSILTGSPQARLVAEKGIKPIPRLTLP